MYAVRSADVSHLRTRILDDSQKINGNWQLSNRVPSSNKLCMIISIICKFLSFIVYNLKKKIVNGRTVFMLLIDFSIRLGARLYGHLVGTANHGSS